MTDFAAKSARIADLRARGLASVSYEVVIDEDQRARIERALKMLDAIEPDPADVPLLGMIEALPADEAECPGILHGLCL